MYERLEKVVASRLGISRKDATTLIKSGKVSINQMIVKNRGAKADLQKVSVFVNGEMLTASDKIYIMQNKPAGIVSASEGEKCKTVIDILPKELYRKNLFPAGRLDKDTTGFVLITNDGNFAHEILSPKKHVEKEYIVTVDGMITDEIISEFTGGLTFKNGERFKCAALIIKERSNGKSVANITLTEGKYHQIKRMFAFFSLTVTKLHRIRIGGLYLYENLKFGESIWLTDEQVQKIK